MDVSKLPKLSQTPPQASNAEPASPTPQPPPPYTGPVDNAGPEAWISIACGALLLFMSPRLLQYLFSSNFTWTFNDAQGNPLAYTQTVFFWGDLSITAFAVVLIVEGLVLAFLRRPIFILLALVFTAATTLLNLGYLVTMMGQNYGFQVLSALAVIFGVYIAWWQFRLLKSQR